MDVGSSRRMRDFDGDLAAELQAIQARGLYRQLHEMEGSQSVRIRVNGRELLNFSSNDYLGLANHPDLKAAAIQAVERYGAGSGASRLISGSLRPHRQLEDALAAFKRTEAALTFSSGYATALGTIGALVGTGDIIILDKLVHACIVDAARLSGAKIRVFAHNDLNDLEEILAWAASRPSSLAARPPRVLIVTESIFSMDGDSAPLADLVRLKDRFGAWLMLDEAHATGLYGPRRCGLAEAQGVSDRVEVQMGTLGKALGAAGGYICGSRKLIDLLVNRARSFIFSTAPVPAAAGAAHAGIALVQSEAGAQRCARLWRRVGECFDQAQEWLPSLARQPRSAIVPILIGDEGAALQAAVRLREQQIFLPAIRYPTVARGGARLRMTLTAEHDSEDVTRVLAAVRALTVA
jgi:8-amino-7-oxononanoate synthase